MCASDSREAPIDWGFARARRGRWAKRAVERWRRRVGGNFEGARDGLRLAGSFVDGSR